MYYFYRTVELLSMILYKLFGVNKDNFKKYKMLRYKTYLLDQDKFLLLEKMRDPSNREKKYKFNENRYRLIYLNMLLSVHESMPIEVVNQHQMELYSASMYIDVIELSNINDSIIKEISI